MKALRWAGALFLVAGIAAAPLNLLHAHFFSGAEIARVPLPLSSTTSGANSSPGKPRAPQVYPPLIINLDPAQSPVVVLLEAAYVLGQGSPGASNRYTTHLISGSSIAAKGDAVLEASGTASEPRMTSLTLLRAKINAPGAPQFTPNTMPARAFPPPRFAAHSPNEPPRAVAIASMVAMPSRLSLDFARSTYQRLSGIGA